MTMHNNHTITPRVVTFEDATNLAIGRAKQLVSCLIEERGHNKPPFLPQDFARLVGIKQIIKAELGETSAVLLRFGNGHVIKVNKNHNLTRQNFSCAHEVGHDLLSELKIELNTENIEYRTFDPQARGKIVAKVRERLCDIIATELLMPEFVFSKYLSGFGVSVHSIERLAKVFRVSFQATARRIVELSPEPCLALFWNPWPRNKPEGLRLDWCIGAEKNTVSKHTFVSFKRSSTLYKAYQYDSPRSHKLFKLPMESKRFGYGEKRYVISLAFPSR